MSTKGTQDEQQRNGAAGDALPPADVDSGDGMGAGEHSDGMGQNDPGVGDDLPWEGFPEEHDESAGSLEAGQVEARKATLRLAENAAQGDEAVRQARMEPDLVKRAKAMVRLGAINFPEEKPVNSGGMVVMQPLLSDVNLWSVFDALFGTALPDRPHFDTFRGRSIGYDGVPLDANTPIKDLTLALSVAGLKGLKAGNVRESYKTWINDERMNDLEARFSARVPEWDGQERLETFLMDLFQPFDTPLNREFGQYFWLSLYNRIIDPGCFAPMVLSLFGGQNAGKSYMSKLICQEVIGPDSNAVALDLASIGNGTFLRSITGNSVIANIGEMNGFNRGDLNKIKAFITTDSEMMDYKYEAHVMQKRQWIIVMDGNKYEGLQRDDSGNRRFYPMFCGQLPDVMGQPAWQSDFNADFTRFGERFWLVMAECRAWMDRNGERGYQKFVDGVVKKVKEFSEYEMKHDRGTVRDDVLEMFLVPVMLSVKAMYVDSRSRRGVFIRTRDIVQQFDKFDRKNRIITPHLKPKLGMYGGVADMFKNERGYFFSCYESIEDFRAAFKGRDTEDFDAEIEVDQPGGSDEGAGSRDDNGGF